MSTGSDEAPFVFIGCFRSNFYFRFNGFEDTSFDVCPVGTNIE
jgi:hypothetical protein